MTDTHRKRKFAGPRIQELKQVDQDPAKHGHKPKPREYVLTSYEQKIIINKRVATYPSRKARDQAKLVIQKAADASNHGRSRWHDKYEISVWFEESEL